MDLCQQYHWCKSMLTHGGGSGAGRRSDSLKHCCPQTHSLLRSNLPSLSSPHLAGKHKSPKWCRGSISKTLLQSMDQDSFPHSALCKGEQGKTVVALMALKYYSPWVSCQHCPFRWWAYHWDWQRKVQLTNWLLSLTGWSKQIFFLKLHVTYCTYNLKKIKAYRNQETRWMTWNW